MRTSLPSKPSSRSASAALAPAKPAPTIANVSVSGIASDPFGECQELLARPCVVAHEPEERRGDGGRPGLRHAAKGHAHVLGLDDDADALGLQLLLEPVRDLR